MHQRKIPRICKRILIAAIPKLEKPLGDLIHLLLCVHFKILDRLIYTCVKPIIDPVHLHEQAGFQNVRLTADLVTLLTQDIEDRFLAKKAGDMFVNLTAAYNIVWHHSLTCKPLRLLADKNMVRTPHGPGAGWQSQLPPYHK